MGVLAKTSLRKVRRLIAPGMRVFVPGMSGESIALFEELRRNSEVADGVTFVGVHFPGINQTDYLSLHPNARQRAYFLTPTLRAGLATGRVDLMPLDYPGIVRDLEDGPGVDMAIAQVSPPDAHGKCSLGASYDFVPSIWRGARLRVVHINPRVPRTRGSFSVRTEDCHLAFEEESILPTLSTGLPDDVSQLVAIRVAGLVEDGDTLQIGVGRIQSAVLAALGGHRRLKIYSGMVTTPILPLIDTGTIDGERAVTAGVALGDETFYKRIGTDPTFYFRPARETHDVLRLARIKRFCAVNSAIEIDLFGQVNADCINGKLVAGVGGLPAFAAGSRLSAGGRLIIALPATGDGGRISRIVPSLGRASLVALPRHAADIVATEYGVANLRARSLHERARALIDIAAPQFRTFLGDAWAAHVATL